MHSFQQVYYFKKIFLLIQVMIKSALNKLKLRGHLSVRLWKGRSAVRILKLPSKFPRIFSIQIFKFWTLKWLFIFKQIYFLVWVPACFIHSIDASVCSSGTRKLIIYKKDCLIFVYMISLPPQSALLQNTTHYSVIFHFGKNF